MPSQLHEALVELFRNLPELAPMLLKGVLGEALPEYVEIQMPSSDLTDVQPIEYRADLVLVLRDQNGQAVFSMAVEAQLRVDPSKRFSMPSYCVLLRSRHRCPATVLVVTPSESVARWAAQPIDLGAGNSFTPLVIGPSAIPYVTDLETARKSPELAVLSAMAHGQDADIEIAVRVAIAGLGASADLDDDKSLLYCDLIRASLGEAAKKALQAMDLSKYEYQSEFAKRYHSAGIEEGIERGLEQGVAQGQLAGQARMLLRVLEGKFSPLPMEVTLRVQGAMQADLTVWAERIFAAESLDAIFED